MGDPVEPRRPLLISGGADPEHAAVIAAIIEQITAEEVVPPPPEPATPSVWSRSLRRGASQAPVPSHVYEAMGGWGPVGDDDEHLRS